MKTYLLLFLTIPFLGFYSCKEKNTQPPPTATGANLKGAVSLYSDGLTSLPNEGMTVRIENSDPVISVETNSNGEYLFEDLLFGTYNLVFEKENYGVYKIYSILHKNGTTDIAVTPSLGEKSTTEVLELTQSLFEQDILVSVYCAPAASTSNSNYLRYFLGLTPQVSSGQHTDFSAGFTSNIDPYVITFTQTQLNNFGFDSGTTVYIKVYGDSFWSNTYVDPDEGNMFPNLNPNTVDPISFVVP